MTIKHQTFFKNRFFKRLSNLKTASILSVIAILISMLNVIFTSPFFLDVYNKPNLVVRKDVYFEGPLPNSMIDIITNESKKPITHLILTIDSKSAKSIEFVPDNSFRLVDSTKKYGFSFFIYSKDILIPREMIQVFLSNIDTIPALLETVSGAYEIYNLRPRVFELKCDNGFAKFIPIHKTKGKFLGIPFDHLAASSWIPKNKNEKPVKNLFGKLPFKGEK